MNFLTLPLKSWLHGLKDENGDWHDNKLGMERAVVDYFTKLFDSYGGENLNMVLDHITPRVTDAMNADLLRIVSNEEVKEALFQMHPTKSPGPDGMSPGFYQKHWDVVGVDVCDGVRSMLQSGCMLCKINYTHVTLILKVKNPTEMSQMRPISLCNVLLQDCCKGSHK